MSGFHSCFSKTLDISLIMSIPTCEDVLAQTHGSTSTALTGLLLHVLPHPCLFSLSSSCFFAPLLSVLMRLLWTVFFRSFIKSCWTDLYTETLLSFDLHGHVFHRVASSISETVTSQHADDTLRRGLFEQNIA